MVGDSAAFRRVIDFYSRYTWVEVRIGLLTYLRTGTSYSPAQLVGAWHWIMVYHRRRCWRDYELAVVVAVTTDKETHDLFATLWQILNAGYLFLVRSFSVSLISRS